MFSENLSFRKFAPGINLFSPISVHTHCLFGKIPCVRFLSMLVYIYAPAPKLWFKTTKSPQIYTQPYLNATSYVTLHSIVPISSQQTMQPLTSLQLRARHSVLAASSTVCLALHQCHASPAPPVKPGLEKKEPSHGAVSRCTSALQETVLLLFGPGRACLEPLERMESEGPG